MPLAVCATPIGNLGDVTLRVLEELASADVVLCEDTRHTRTLLDRGHQVTVLDNFLFGQNSLLDCCPSEKFSVVRGDCRDELLIPGQ